VFSYQDELMELKENPEPRNPVGFKRTDEQRSPKKKRNRISQFFVLPEFSFFPVT
jgi:hypothetical protein